VPNAKEIKHEKYLISFLVMVLQFSFGWDVLLSWQEYKLLKCTGILIEATKFIQKLFPQLEHNTFLLHGRSVDKISLFHFFLLNAPL